MKAETYLCPGCDKEVVIGSLACPRCNPPAKRRKRPKAVAKKVRRSWEEDPASQGLDLPDEEFDYDDFVAREFGMGRQRTGIRWYWWLTALVVIILMVLAGFSLCGWGLNAWK